MTPAALVTRVLIGKCTYAKRSVDLEFMASLHHGVVNMASEEERELLPNALVGVMLKSYHGGDFPDRLNTNLQVLEVGVESYAVVIPYPKSKEELAEALETAQRNRLEKRHLIDNTSHMFSEDHACL